MDPVALGAAAAALVAKAALSKLGGEAAAAGWGVLGRVPQRLRDWFGALGASDGAAALELVEAAPDSEHAQQRLAAQVTQVVREDASVAGALERLLDEVAESAEGSVATFVVQVRDQAKVGRIYTAGRDLTINEGG
jgi:hypothetical protein